MVLFLKTGKHRQNIPRYKILNTGRLILNITSRYSWYYHSASRTISLDMESMRDLYNPVSQSDQESSEACHSLRGRNISDEEVESSFERLIFLPQAFFSP